MIHEEARIDLGEDGLGGSCPEHDDIFGDDAGGSDKAGKMDYSKPFKLFDEKGMGVIPVDQFRYGYRRRFLGCSWAPMIDGKKTIVRQCFSTLLAMIDLQSFVSRTRCSGHSDPALTSHLSPSCTTMCCRCRRSAITSTSNRFRR